jgi:histidinol-phosphatase (PHP family)
VQALRQAHAHELAVYHGIEWDMMSESNLAEFDYVIGSIHQIESQGEVFCVDASPATTADYLQRAFGGDADAAAEAYFRQYAALAKVDEVDIVGHFDLLTKFDELNGFFHADSARFHAAALEAMEVLVSAGKIFEINTGAISRGYRTRPYPSRALLTELKRMGGRITISADAHSIDAIAYGFAAAEMLALDCGFTEIRVFDGQAFVPESIGKVNEYD